MQKSKSFIIELVETLIFSLIVILLIFHFIAFPEQVVGASMYPTMKTGDRILVQKVSMRFREFKRGEIVVLVPPGKQDIHYVKRLIGLPGDILKISDCKVSISRNGSKFTLEEYYLSESVCTKGDVKIRDGRSIRLKDNEYVVFGDNRRNSVDSRIFGIINKENIQGSVVFRFWPTQSVGFFKNDTK